MIKHIVAWKLKDKALNNSKEENKKKAKQLLEALKDKISEIIHIEVGVDFSKTENSSDIILYSTFNNIEDLNAYQMHPEHKKVGAFIKDIVFERRVVDYEV